MSHPYHQRVLAARVGDDVASSICALLTPVVLSCSACRRPLLYEETIPVALGGRTHHVCVAPWTRDEYCMWVDGHPLHECGDALAAWARVWWIDGREGWHTNPDAATPSVVAVRDDHDPPRYFENRRVVVCQHQWYVYLNPSSYYCFRCARRARRTFDALRKKI